MSAVRVVLGTMSIGGPVDGSIAKGMIAKLKSYGHTQVDTAIMYQGGKTEIVLGESGISQDPEISIATKVNPWFDGAKTGMEPNGGLSAENVRKQLLTSLKNMGLASVPLCYLHAPDHATPIDETLAEMNTLYKEGLFKEFGLSNYSSWQVMDIHHRCSQNGWVLPTIYQGMYNAVTREVEAELFPCLRNLGMKFYAYNPTAGGLLTGRYSVTDDPEEGRFSSKTPWGKVYRKRFWNDALFEHLDKLKASCASHGMSTTQASLRWMMHHSKLQAGDSVIVGGSCQNHVDENLKACSEGPLPDDVISILDGAYVHLKGSAPAYFR